MRRLAACPPIGSVAVLAIGLATVAGLGVAVGVHPVGGRGQVIQDVIQGAIQQVIQPAVQPVGQHVDRTHKGDRLDLNWTAGRRTPRPVQEEPAERSLGCEPASGTLAAPARADRWGRCIAQIRPVRLTAG